jgi:hypothetical protein
MHRFLTFWIPMAAGLVAAGGASAAEQYLRMPADQHAPAKSNLTAYFDEAAEEAEDEEAADEEASDESAKGDCGCESSSGCGSEAG